MKINNRSYYIILQEWHGNNHINIKYEYIMTVEDAFQHIKSFGELSHWCYIWEENIKSHSLESYDDFVKKYWPWQIFTTDNNWHFQLEIGEYNPYEYDFSDKNTYIKNKPTVHIKRDENGEAVGWVTYIG